MLADGLGRRYGFEQIQTQGASQAPRQEAVQPPKLQLGKTAYQWRRPWLETSLGAWQSGSGLFVVEDSLRGYLRPL